jgi:phosphate starvation-inducible PhoH-like protein
LTSSRTAGELDLEPADNLRLANLCGQLDEHLRHIEERLGVDIAYRGCHFRVTGDDTGVALALAVISYLYGQTDTESLTPEHVHFALQELGSRESQLPGTQAAGPVPRAAAGDSGAREAPAAADGPAGEGDDAVVIVRARRLQIRGRGANQRRYLRNIREVDLNFGVGPAGTGKTYLAVAAAVEALDTERVRRLVLVRPAVEAGERLGFLPGDMSQKVDPYLRPIYDALYEMLGFEHVARLIERHIIEVAPLAFMRGRSLNEAFVILDEAQNTTVSQMKMFLTRIGFGTRAVVTGDVTQVDLPRSRLSGLRHALEVLDHVEGVRVTRFGVGDVVRHPLVQRIVDAYERAPAVDDEGSAR